MLNNQIFFSLYNLVHKNSFFDSIIFFLGDILPYVVVLATIIFLLFHHEILQSKNPFAELKQKWKEITIVFFAGGLAWCISGLLKVLIQSPRPFVEFSQVHTLFPETGYGFPSGHATFYMALAFAMYFSHKKTGYVMMILAFLIGIARIFAGVHFPLDILGGWALGAVTAHIVRMIYDKLHTKKSA